MGAASNKMTATILVIEDDVFVRHSLERLLSLAGYEVLPAGSGREGTAIFESRRCDLVLLDVRLPDGSGLDILKHMRAAYEDMLVIMVTAFPAVQAAVAAVKAGAYDYIVKPFDSEELKCTIDRALATRELKSEVLRLRHEHKRRFQSREMVGTSPAMTRLKEWISKVASTDASVLIQGESGTGKELIADAIHDSSSRRGRALVKINCSAIPAELIESELFGHEAGAFTGAAKNKTGLFELADRGTLFLDEISEMALALQPKLLRVLEGQTLRRVGGVREIPVDVRIVAATNRDLRASVTAGNFRQDLFYRLGGMVIDVPPLRERRDDILLIARSILDDLRVETRKTISGLAPEVQEMLLDYPWPGNVRELRNVLERAVILADSGVLLPEHLPMELLAWGGDQNEEADVNPGDAAESLEAAERLHIARVLQSTHGNRTEAARRLGISRSTLKRKLKRFPTNSTN